MNEAADPDPSAAKCADNSIDGWVQNTSPHSLWRIAKRNAKCEAKRFADRLNARPCAVPSVVKFGLRACIHFATP